MKGTDRYQVADVACELDGRSLRVVNLSVSGFFAQSEAPPEQGTRLRMGLRLPDEPTLDVEARVAWVNEPDAPRNPHLPTGFGVKLQRISFPQRMAILRYLGRTDPSELRGS